MKPDVLPLNDVSAITAKGDVVVVTWPDFDRAVSGLPSVAVREENGFKYTTFPHVLIASPRPFGPLALGHILRFKSLTGETDWSGIAEYCSIFDGAREITKYAMQKAVGVKDEEHG